MRRFFLNSVFLLIVCFMFCSCGASNKNIKDNNVPAKQEVKLSKIDPIVVCKSFDLSKAEIRYNDDTSIFATQLSKKLLYVLKRPGIMRFWGQKNLLREYMWRVIS